MINPGRRKRILPKFYKPTKATAAKCALFSLYTVSLFCLTHFGFTSIFWYYNLKTAWTWENFLIGGGFLSLLSFFVFFFMKDGTFSSIIEVMLALCVVPSVVYFVEYGIPLKYFLINAVFWSFFIGLAICFCQAKLSVFRSIELGIPKYRLKFVPPLLLLICGVVVTYVWGKYGGFNTDLSISNSSVSRIEMRAAGLPTSLSYLFTFSGGVFLPMLFAYFSNNRQWFLAFISFLFGVACYATNGMKTWLLIYILEFFVIFLSNRKASPVSLFLAFSVLLFISSYIAAVYLKKYELIAFARRIYNVPSESTYFYIDFFQEHEFIFLRESIGRFFAKSPYQPSIGLVIGPAYHNNENENVVVGLAGDAYANFGILGMLFYPFLYVIVFKLFSAFSVGKNKRFITCLGILIIWYSLNVSFFTWLLTGGVIFSLLFLWTVPQTSESKHLYLVAHLDETI